MTQFSERHTRLIKKEQELEKLFEEAANRRRRLLQQNNDETFNFHNEKCKRDKCILKPLRSSENLLSIDSNDNKIEISLRDVYKKLHRHSAYYSHHNLPETNLDYDGISLHRSNNSNHNSNNNCDNSTTKSSENLTNPRHHNPNPVNYQSLSSDEVDDGSTFYCQFVPTTATSLSTNTSSSHYSKTTDTSSGKLSSLGPSSSEVGSHSTRDTDYSRADFDDNTHSVRGEPQDEVTAEAETRKLSTLIFYPSGSPLISHKYQGSPVVRIDEKLRAGEADYLVNRRRPSSLKKAHLLPRFHKLPHKPMTGLATPETRLSHPVLIEVNECDHNASTPLSGDNYINNSTSIIRRTKKKLLEEQMRKRFSVGDYSTRALIEWENNLNFVTVEQMSMSVDLVSHSNDRNQVMKRTLSTQFDAHIPIDFIGQAHNFSSEGNIVRYSSSESIRDAQVSFRLKNEQNSDDKFPSRNSNEKFSQRTKFIRRSMNDLVAALKHVTSSEKLPSNKKFLFSHRKPFIGHGLFKKREATSSDLLYSVPPFARQHMPPDISGATRITSQGTYKNPNLPSSSPNLIAELDPTFQERYGLESPPTDIHNCRQPFSNKRNRSYRLSFIENAHTVTTKKLTATNSSSSSANPNVLRFVQPRRRIQSHNSVRNKCHDGLPKMERKALRSRSSNRFSCAQQ